MLHFRGRIPDGCYHDYAKEVRIFCANPREYVCLDVGQKSVSGFWCIISCETRKYEAKWISAAGAPVYVRGDAVFEEETEVIRLDSAEQLEFWAEIYP